MAAMIIFWRRDLLLDALLSGILLMMITFFIYLFWILLFPSAFSDYWITENMSGWHIVQIPIEELLYLFAWGTVIGPLYEVMEGLRLRRI